MALTRACHTRVRANRTHTASLTHIQYSHMCFISIMTEMYQWQLTTCSAQGIQSNVGQTPCCKFLQVETYLEKHTQTQVEECSSSHLTYPFFSYGPASKDTNRHFDICRTNKDKHPLNSHRGPDLCQNVWWSRQRTCDCAKQCDWGQKRIYTLKLWFAVFFFTEPLIWWGPRTAEESHA